MSSAPSWAEPAIVVALHRRSLKRWHRDLSHPERLRLQRAAASAFYQAGVRCHKRLLLQEILLSFNRPTSAGDPADAVLALLPSGDFAEQAGRYYDVALALAPPFAEAHYNRASLYRRAGHLDQAMQSYEAALAVAPHTKAKPHAFLHANAAWEAAKIAATTSRTTSAAALFGKAMARLNNFGVDHHFLPDYLDRSGMIAEAMSEYERVMSYSHRYAPEFIEPSFDRDEMLPIGPDGQPLDPLVPTLVAAADGARTIYFLHLYFSVTGSERLLGEDLAAAIRRSKIATLFGQPELRIVACAPSLEQLQEPPRPA